MYSYEGNISSSKRALIEGYGVVWVVDNPKKLIVEFEDEFKTSWAREIVYGKKGNLYIFDKEDVLNKRIRGFRPNERLIMSVIDVELNKRDNDFLIDSLFRWTLESGTIIDMCNDTIYINRGEKRWE